MGQKDEPPVEDCAPLPRRDACKRKFVRLALRATSLALGLSHDKQCRAGPGDDREHACDASGGRMLPIDDFCV